MPEEKTPLELAREELAEIRCEALHGDVRAAVARLIDRIGDGVTAAHELMAADTTGQA